MLYLLILSLFYTQTGDNTYFKIRGIVEGFYGSFYTNEQRKDFIEFIAHQGMNCYLYAPKSDPQHRRNWRKGYSNEEMEDFREAITLSRRLGVHFVIGLSPGLNPGKGDIRGALYSKFQDFASMGCRDFAVLYDDIKLKSPFSQGEDHKRTVNDLLKRLKSSYPDCNIFFCPTVYAGLYAKKRAKSRIYLKALRGLDPRLIAFWTGDGSSAFSPKITRQGAAQMKRILGCHIVVWDNFPVNDNARRYTYFCPYQGREKQLYTMVDGILMNPMLDPYLSRFPVYIASLYLKNPISYEPNSAYEQAIRFFTTPDSREAFRKIADGLQYNRYVFPGRKNCPELADLIKRFIISRDKEAYALIQKQLKGIESSPNILANGFTDPYFGRAMEGLLKKASNIAKAADLSCKILMNRGRVTDTNNTAQLKNLLDNANMDKRVIFKDVFESLFEAAGAVQYETGESTSSKTVDENVNLPLPDPVENLQKN